jgi:PAS domain S-box-containing protein
MAKKPLKVYSRSQGRMVPVEERTARMPVYADSLDEDRSNITQMVVEHPRGLVDRASGQGDYEDLLHAVYDAVLIASQDGTIVGVNARAEHNFVMSRDDLCHMNIVDLISGADMELLKLVRKNVSNKKFTILEAVCVRGDETRFDAEIVANRLGGQKQLAFFVRDVTLRRQAEAELQTANERLVEAEKIQARLDTLSTLFHNLNNPLQILTCMAEMDENPEYKKQLTRIV